LLTQLGGIAWLIALRFRRRLPVFLITYAALCTIAFATSPRIAALINLFTADPRVIKIFVEPPLATRFNLSDPKIRFQGCRAARHDDHIHIQL
jgi:murein endopeptidase